MIKLKIKTYSKEFKDLPLWSPKNKNRKIIEKVIDFDGQCNGKFITQHSKIDGSLTWAPILHIDDWEVIEEVK